MPRDKISRKKLAFDIASTYKKEAENSSRDPKDSVVDQYTKECVVQISREIQKACNQRKFNNVSLLDNLYKEFYKTLHDPNNKLPANVVAGEFERQLVNITGNPKDNFKKGLDSLNSAIGEILEGRSKAEAKEIQQEIHGFLAGIDFHKPGLEEVTAVDIASILTDQYGKAPEVTETRRPSAS